MTDMKTITAIFLTLVTTHNFALDLGDPISELPIDTAKKAIQEAGRFYSLTSCASWAWNTTVEEESDRWLVAQVDVRTNTISLCPTLKVTVCKTDGSLIVDDEDACRK